MFSIGELAKQTGVKIPTIRYYEKMGLIDMPDRSIGNQRRYSRQGLERLAFIRHARDLGFSISDIRELNALSQHPAKSLRRRPRHCRASFGKRQNPHQKTQTVRTRTQTHCGVQGG